MDDKYAILRSLTGNPLLDEAAVQIESKLIYGLLAERDALRKALQSARQTLTVAIRAAWEDDSEDVSDHLTIKEIDAALSQ